MANFSKFEDYEYISPISLYSRIKLEIPSYFDSGAIDDLLFPIYTEEALQKFKMSFYKKETACLFVENYSSDLPDKFQKVREAWMSTVVYQPVDFVQGFTGQYDIESFEDCKTSCQSVCDDCDDDSVMITIPDYITADYILKPKISTQSFVAYNKNYLLKPANLHAISCCTDNSPNIQSCTLDVFDIRDGKFFVNFKEGLVHLLYYASQTDDEGNPLIPDDYFVKDFIIKYIKAKIFENLRYLSAPETYNQSLNDYQLAQKEADLAYATLSSESKKWTIDKTFRQLRKTSQKFNRFKIR